MSVFDLKLEVLTSKHQYFSIISSPEHEVLIVSYCGQSMSVVRRPSSVVRHQQLLLKPTPPTPLGQLTRYLVGSIGVNFR